MMILQRCYFFLVNNNFKQPPDLMFYFNSGLAVVREVPVLWHGQLLTGEILLLNQIIFLDSKISPKRIHK